MVKFDFSPLYRSTIGFDRVPHLLQAASRLDQGEPAYPPHDIEKVGEEDYRIVMAVAGFSNDDIEIVTERNSLTVRGRITGKKNATYLHHGIARRAFERRFDLADFIEVKGASLADGLLTIELKRELPDRLKPRNIEIGKGQEAPEVVEDHRKAA